MRGERPGEGRRGERRGMSGERERRGLLIRGPLRELVEGLDDGDVKARAVSAEAAVKAALDKIRRPR